MEFAIVQSVPSLVYQARIRVEIGRWLSCNFGLNDPRLKDLALRFVPLFSGFALTACKPSLCYFIIPGMI